MKTLTVSIWKIKSNPNNPRIIKDDKYKKLVKSIKEFPEMLKIRPIVVNDDMVVLGGNMRLKACKEAGLKELSIIKASELTEEQQREFIIKDNVGFGEWDYDILGNEWDSEQLEEWGMDDIHFDYEWKNEEIDTEEMNDEAKITLKYSVIEYEEILELIAEKQSEFDIKSREELFLYLLKNV